MSNLIQTQNPLAQNIIQSLSERVSNSPSLAGQGVVFLLDTSSSMGYFLETPSNYRRIDALQSALQELNPSGGRFFEFNSTISPCDIETPFDPQGGTDLAGALGYLINIQTNQPFNTLILITDGEPLRPDYCLEVARGLKSKINVIFVGDTYNYQAREFCRKLASQFQGQYISNPLDTKNLKLLPTQIKLMLPAQAGPIAL